MPADFFGVQQPTISTGRKGGVPLTQRNADSGFLGSLFGFVDGVTDIIANTAEDAARTARAIVDWDNPHIYGEDSEYGLPASQRLAYGRASPPNRLLEQDIIEGVPNIVLAVGAGILILAISSKK